MDRHEEARRLNGDVNLIGLRAQATAVGLVQLCAELLRAKALDDAAIGRIKTAVADQIIVSYKPKRGREDFETALHRRLDKLFPPAGQGSPAAAVGTSKDLGESLNLDNGE